MRLRWRAFRRDEAGATTVEFVVVTAMVVGLAAAITAAVASGAQSGAERIEKCMEIQGKLIQKDISYEQQLKRMQKRCAKI
jgi:Flp pilus assembly pilin Flp